jgi:hypothetical protein
MPTIFISYRRDDAAGYAGRLHESLERRLGSSRVFRDVDTLQPGQDFVDAIDTNLRQSRVFLALIGREWLDACDTDGQRRLDQPHDHVRLEIAAALARPDLRVIPVLIEGASMPPADALPEAIRPLARRQAVSLGDDDWDHDVDRLAAAIEEITAAHATRTAPEGAGQQAVPRSMFRRLGVAVVVAAIVVTWMAYHARPSESPGASAGGPSGAAAGQAYGVTIPRLSEVVHPSLIYTLLSANVVPLGSSSELRLRFRFSNEGRTDANAWDASFRLKAGGETLTPTSGLNELVPGHSLAQGIVTFRVPRDSGGVVLQVVDRDRIGEIALDLTPALRPAEDERADAGDALSRALIRPVLNDARLLVGGDDLSVTAVKATARRFVNAVQLTVMVRFANRSRVPVASGAATIRLATSAGRLGPIEEPSMLVEPASDALGDLVFEVPTSTTRAVLHATVGTAAGELPIEVPQ